VAISFFRRLFDSYFNRYSNSGGYIRPSINIPRWMDIAIGELGQAEISGPGSNENINRYLGTVGLDPNDDIPWCSAFTNWVFEKCKISGTANCKARSWMDWGKAIQAYKFGAVVVMHRGDPNSWKGHVGFALDAHFGWMYVLGGNQNNRVGVNAYKSSKLLGYRWPVEE